MKTKQILQRSCAVALSLVASLPLVLTGCQDEEFGYSADKIKYQKNFVETYGEIPADKSWDLSSSAGAYNPTATRGAGDLGNGSDNEDLVEGTHYVKKNFWQVPSETLEWLKQNLVEGKDNRWLGSNFVLKIDPSSDFAIVPIYQGRSAITSTLKIKINGYNLKEICPRSADIQAKRTSSSEWENLGYYDGWVGTSHQDYLDYVNEVSGKVMHPSFTDEDYAVQAKPVYFRASQLTHLKDDGFMYLDLVNTDKMYDRQTDPTHKWDDTNVWTRVGDHLTSINSKGQMVALNLSWDGRPQNSELPDIHEGEGANHKDPYQVLIIGCEDAHGEKSDYDVNDVVYMIIGYPNAPEIVPTTQIIKKRYMCEDLGATDDFDFNDIVIDVTQSMQYTLVTNPDDKADDYQYDGNLQVWMQPENNTKKQWAKVSHVCGTLPFQIKVGNYFFPKVTDPTDDYNTRTELAQPARQTRGHIDIAATDGWNPNEAKEISGWDPDNNNVAICVEWKRGNKADNQEHFTHDYSKENGYDNFADYANGNYKIAEFPQNGDVPYIIAVDQDIPWMKERVSIPDSWVSGHFHDRTGAAGPGSCAQYLDYGNDTAGHTNEAVIWNGDVFGQPYITGLDLGQDNTSATYAGLVETFGKSFNIIAVYTDKPGAFGFCGHGAEGWERLHSNDPDQYVVSTQLVDGLYCTKIMLTSDQIGAIRDNHKGLIVQNCTEGMHIQKVSMMRNNPDRGGFGVRFNISDGGKVTTPAYRRYRDDNKDNVPFEDATFPNGSSVEFTATPEEGYTFVNWTFAGQDIQTSSSTTNPLTISREIMEGYGISNGIIRITANYSARTLCKVGAHIQVNGEDNNAPGKIQLTTEGNFHDENGNLLPSPKSVTLANNEYVYVYRGTSVTFHAPINSDYKIAQQSDANSFNLETMTRTSVIDNEPNTPFTPYIKYTEKTDPNAYVSTSNIRFDGTDIVVQFYSDHKSWPELRDPDGLVEIMNGNDKNGEMDGDYIKYVLRQKKNAPGKITIFQAADDTYKSCSFDIDVSVNYGTKVQLGDVPSDIEKKSAWNTANTTWYFNYLSNVMNLVNNQDLSKGVKFTFVLSGYGLTTFNIASNKGDTGMKKVLWESSAAQNGAVWNGNVRTLTYIMGSEELKYYFENTSSFFVGGNINTSTLSVELYVEATNN